MDRFKFIKGKDFNELPKTPGVYAFFVKNLKFKIKNLKLECIYIGKAINIQNRVKNHFFQPSYRDNLFISKVEKIGYFETNSEIEALVLEANLIKKHQPKFNVIWKDDKNYFYVAFVKNNLGTPYVFITHQPKLHPKPYTLNPVYIGPFVEGTALKKTLRFLRKVFPYYSAKNHPRTKCTYCHLDLCPGPEPDLKEYKKNIKKLILILQGKRSAVLNSLKKEMKKLSKKNKFEKAGETRDKIYNLQQVMSHTHVIDQQNTGVSENRAIAYFSRILGLEKDIKKIECYDISNIQGKQATGSMVVFIDGKPDKSQYKKFKIKLGDTPNDIAMLKEILERRFSHKEWTYPDAILIDGGKAQLNAGINQKSEYRNPKQVQNIKILSLAKENKELFIEGREKPVLLKSLPKEIYNLVLQLDSEAHRFAINYHKKLRKKNLLQ